MENKNIDSETEETQSDVLSMRASLDKRAQSLREKLNSDVQAMKTLVDDMRGKVTKKLAELDVRAMRGSCRYMVTGADRIKPPRFDESTSWAMFRHQFEAVAGYNNWAPWEKATHLSAVLQGQAADVLHGVPAEATYEDIVEALPCLYGDNQLTATYCPQLSDGTQLIGESSQEFATTTEQ
jgi:hypothetical protein